MLPFARKETNCAHGTEKGCHAKHARKKVILFTSLLMHSSLIAAVFLLLIAVTATAVNAQNPNCALLVPPNPLSAQGLATPYVLVPVDPTQGPCSMSNLVQQAFVNAAVVDLDKGVIYNYNPLVVTNGTTAAIPPVVPALPANNVVGLWFSSNAQLSDVTATLTLLPWPGAAEDSLIQGQCSLGATLGDQFDPFNQVAFCNAPAFFAAVSSLISAGKISVPDVGTAHDNQPCPTVRGFDVIDDNQSDTVPTSYYLLADGTTAQYSITNQKALNAANKTFQLIDNASDELLLSGYILPALGCTPWEVQDITDPNNYLITTTFPTDEIQALYKQVWPMAQVPSLDPDVLVGLTSADGVYANGQPSINKLNAYRINVAQTLVSDINEANTTFYCQAYATVATNRLVSAHDYFIKTSTPDDTLGNNLFTFLVERFILGFGPEGLNCTGILSMSMPVSCVYNNNSVCVQASVSPVTLLANWPNTPALSATPTPTVTPTQALCTNDNQATVAGLAATVGVLVLADVILFAWMFITANRRRSLFGTGGKKTENDDVPLHDRS